jgi:two-component system, chemotaxis family, protein-glutamate methylesterase/glutaminase
MPRSALAAVADGLAVPAARIGDVLADLVQEQAGPRLPVPPEIRLEVDIAAGERVDSGVLRRFADPVALSCPHCGGVLSEVRGAKPLRFRCQVGHAYTAEAAAKAQEGAVDEAMRVALRIVGERAELVARMAAEARETGRNAVAEMYEARGAEYRDYAETLRRAVLGAFEPGGDGGGEPEA